MPDLLLLLLLLLVHVLCTIVSRFSVFQIKRNLPIVSFYVTRSVWLVTVDANLIGRSFMGTFQGFENMFFTVNLS